MYYPKCKPNFHNVGCCICSPNCPSGMRDSGILCHKSNIYGRGAGKDLIELEVKEGEEESISSLFNYMNNQNQQNYLKK
jgi:hypothetical protein